MTKKLTGFILLLIAVGLAWYGYDMSQAFASKISSGLTGGPTNRVLMFYGGAAACAVFGLWRLVK